MEIYKKFLNSNIVGNTEHIATTTTPKSDVIIHIKKPFTPTSICIFLCPKSIVKDEGFCLLLVRISSFPSRFPWEIPISTLF